MGQPSSIGGGLFGSPLTSGGNHGQSRQTNSQVYSNSLASQSTGTAAFNRDYTCTCASAQGTFPGAASFYSPNIVTVEDGRIEAGEITGWRVWKAYRGRLYSYTMDEVEWPPGSPLKRIRWV